MNFKYLEKVMNFNISVQYIATAFAIIASFGLSGCGEPTPAEGEKMRAESLNLDAEPERQVRIKTEFGDMVVQLSNQTPQHRDNFVELVEKGFYDSLTFHRVINEFMIQGGDPISRTASLSTPLGSGGPGYKVPAEINTDQFHFKGALAAARQGDGINPERNSSGSQFYLVHGRPFSKEEILTIEARNFKPNDSTGEPFKYSDEAIMRYMTDGGTPFLDNNYTVFGQVVEGLEIIDSVASVPTGAGNRPRIDVRMAMEVIR